MAQITTIETQKKQADLLINQINELQGTNSSPVTSGSRQYPDLNYRNSRYNYGYGMPYDVEGMQQIAFDIDRLSRQLQILLNTLIRNYGSAITLTDRNADLAYYKPALEKGLKWAQGVFFQNSNRPARVDRQYNWSNY